MVCQKRFKLRRVRDALAVCSFFGTWGAVWLAAWLAGLHFVPGSDLPAFIGGYLGCVVGALVAPNTVVSGPARQAVSGTHKARPR